MSYIPIRAVEDEGQKTCLLKKGKEYIIHVRGILHVYCHLHGLSGEVDYIDAYRTFKIICFWNMVIKIE